MQRTIVLLMVMSAIVAACASNSYELRVNEARNHIIGNRFDNAESLLNNLIDRYPRKPELHYLLGDQNYRRGDFNSCLVHFDRAERMGYEGGYSFYAEKGISLYRIGSMKEAETALRRSIAMNPSPEAGKYLGIILSRQGNNTAALPYLQTALESFPDDVDILASLGRTLSHTGNTAEAAAMLKRASDANPGNAGLAFDAANMLMLSERFDEAFDLYKSIPNNAPMKDESLYNAGNAALHMGDYSAAVRVLKDYAVINPDDTEALINLASAMIKTGEFVEAIDALAPLARNNIQDVRISYNLGLAYLNLKAYAQAADILADAVEGYPEDPEFRYALALALTGTGNISSARKQMDAVLRSDPTHTNALKWMKQYPETTVRE